jgi:parvulin-like peptidyl-prolyl isomerase
VTDELILLERAREARLTVDDGAVDSAIATMREENNLEDEATFEAALAQAGMSVDILRERYRRNMLVSRAVQSEVQPTEITTEELRRMYEDSKETFKTPEKVVLEQIFFPVADDGNDADQVRRRAVGLINRVGQGADLVAEATLAGVEVQDLGEIPVADLRPELLAALGELEPGGLSEPLALSGGYQVLRLIERIPEGYQPFEEVEELLRRRKSQMLYQEQTRGLVDRLREDYLVEVHDELLTEVLEGAFHA